jgi:hypothetical protein
LTLKYLLIKFIICALSVSAWAGEILQTNLAVTDTLIERIVDEDLANPMLQKGDTLAIILPVGNEALVRYTGLTMANMLKEKGLEVYRNKISQGYLFEIGRIALSIAYGDPYSSGLFGSDLAQRKITMNLIGQIRQEPSGKIIKSINSTKIYSDEIIYDQIEELEASSYSFTQGTRQRYSTWDTIVEPALIITSVVVVVLLFFTQRA